jgi:hypothetical protein
VGRAGTGKVGRCTIWPGLGGSREGFLEEETADMEDKEELPRVVMESSL